ncbi:MAG: hypothetical protein HC830_11320 [Bacteroidetes bacterium]|nr:hypothetical protein [Bacteroidota bacterium]
MLGAQEILLEKDLNESVYMKKKGPNKQRFTHLYFDFGPYFLQEQDPGLYEDGKSMRTFIGLRNYYRIANPYIMGVELEFGWEEFYVKQTNQKTFPSAGMHKTEKLTTSNIGLTYFNRFLFTQREHALGVWLDAGIYGNLSLSSRHVIKDKTSSTSDARIHKEINKGLKYLNPWEYGLKGRLGFKRYAAVFTYRLSDWVSGTTNEYEPPRVSVGLEFGFY